MTLSDEQAHRNAAVRERRALYASHRAKLSALILRDELPRGSVCLLGAGNANDVELSAIARAYDRVHLVDLDAAALGFAAEKLAPDERNKVTLHGGTDVTSILPELERWTHAPPAAGELAKILARATEPAIELPQSDLVVSCTLLSQLVELAKLALGEADPRLLELVLALRLGHLRLLARTARPGGRSIVVTDVVASDTVPGLDRTPEPELGELLVRLVRERNFFTGANPFAIAEVCKTDSDLKSALATLRLHRPWRWQFAAERSYLVSAIELRRNP